jgi:signal transduction histidine kinase
MESRIQEGIEVIADPRLMKSLIGNLVSNAWKYSAGKQRVEIAFTCEYTAEGPVYCIRDRGAGFDMTRVTHLFQPFRRLHTVREFPGTGVGLAIVARVARRYGGTVSARGEVGSGATFCFTLPRAQIADDVESRCA